VFNNYGNFDVQTNAIFNGTLDQTPTLNNFGTSVGLLARAIARLGSTSIPAELLT